MKEPVDLQALVRVINETLILAVLRDEAKHGYQIALDVQGRTSGGFSFQHGTLYPILHRLERDKRIEGAWGRAGGRKRKIYGLTRAGRDYLAECSGLISEVFEALEALLGSDR